jgi:hypothetical protein
VSFFYHIGLLLYTAIKMQNMQIEMQGMQIRLIYSAVQDIMIIRISAYHTKGGDANEDTADGGRR